MKLTKRSIDAMRFEGRSLGRDQRGHERFSRDLRWDDEISGLGVRIYPSGKKAFVLSYRSRKSPNPRLMALGRYGVITVDEARSRARTALARVDDGGDPLDDRAKERAAQTFGELAEQYIQDHAKRHKKTWKEDDRRLKSHIPSSWKHRRIESIARKDVSALHRKIGETRPYEANRLVDLLRKMFGLARSWGALPDNATNPAAGIDKFRETKRKRFLTADELPRLARAIDRETSIYVRAALWLYLLTGMRKNELLPRRWADVDWSAPSIKLPDTKSGEQQTVPLSSAAVAILQAIPRVEGNQHILPGTKEKRPLVNISKAWRRVRESATVEAWAESDDPEVRNLVARLSADLGGTPTWAQCVEAAGDDLELPTGLADLTLHDLRRTVGSWLTQSGVDLNLVKDALRHANISTTLTYARLGRDAARPAMEQHGERIMAAAGRLRLVETTN